MNNPNNPQLVSSLACGISPASSPPTETDWLNHIAFSGRILGALFSYPPDNPETAPLINELTQTDWPAQWPVSDPALPAIARQFRHSLQATESLTEAWQRLFIGPWALPAPPWGSVWLDHEQVLFGDSMLQLRQWLREQHIISHNNDTEPCDHIGTLLLLAAFLAQNRQPRQLEQLLAWHLLPWAWRFLDVFSDKAAHPFYQALGHLSQLSLRHWQNSLLIPVAKKELYL